MYKKKHNATTVYFSTSANFNELISTFLQLLCYSIVEEFIFLPLKKVLHRLNDISHSHASVLSAMGTNRNQTVPVLENAVDAVTLHSVVKIKERDVRLKLKDLHVRLVEVKN